MNKQWNGNVFACGFFFVLKIDTVASMNVVHMSMLRNKRAELKRRTSCFFFLFKFALVRYCPFTAIPLESTVGTKFGFWTFSHTLAVRFLRCVKGGVCAFSYIFLGLAIFLSLSSVIQYLSDSCKATNVHEGTHEFWSWMRFTLIQSIWWTLFQFWSLTIILFFGREISSLLLLPTLQFIHRFIFYYSQTNAKFWW